MPNQIVEGKNFLYSEYHFVLKNIPTQSDTLHRTNVLFFEVSMKNSKLVSGLLLSVSSLLLSSCSTPEGLQEKMGRYSPRATSKNNVPQITALAANIHFSKNSSRAPASFDAISDKHTDENMTNKKSYFLSLIDQYEHMKQFSEKFQGPKISICPNFHTGLVTHYEKNPVDQMSKIPLKFHYESDSLKEDQYVDLHPELFLPVTKETTTPRVIDILRNKTVSNENEVNDLVQKAVDIHLAKTYFELSELCEFGASDNYYIYENMITHIQTTNFNPGVENLNTLLKSTVFSNLAIINSLEKQKTKKGRSIASTGDSFESHDDYTKGIIKKLNLSWTLEYFNRLKN
jgi:hypothetical protein